MIYQPQFHWIEPSFPGADRFWLARQSPLMRSSTDEKSSKGYEIKRRMAVQVKWGENFVCFAIHNYLYAVGVPIRLCLDTYSRIMGAQIEIMTNKNEPL